MNDFLLEFKLTHNNSMTIDGHGHGIDISVYVKRQILY